MIQFEFKGWNLKIDKTCHLRIINNLWIPNSSALEEFLSTLVAAWLWNVLKIHKEYHTWKFVFTTISFSVVFHVQAELAKGFPFFIIQVQSSNYYIWQTIKHRT